jgi:tellurite methyltransferase
MQRAITGFTTDDAGDWVAELTCGHPQHVRHRPPFFSRPWVTTEEGRKSKLGQPLDCVRCDRLELPAHLVIYKQTPEFTEATIPAGLMRDHTTRAGVWGRIVVLAGSLRYRVESLAVDQLLGPGTPGIVAPEVPHSVAPEGPVRFFVEFLRADG